LKVLQLELARRVKLDIPRTLVTNSPKEALSFVALLRRSGTAVISKSPADLHYFSAKTELVDECTLDQIDRISLSPTILQQRITGGPDLRIIVVGSRLFGMSLTAHPEYEVDCRMDPAPRIEPFDVPGPGCRHGPPAANGPIQARLRVHHRLAGRASAAPGSALKQTSSLDHAGEPTDAPRSSSPCGISDIERLHP
jgi:hypothetical protein